MSLSDPKVSKLTLYIVIVLFVVLVALFISQLFVHIGINRINEDTSEILRVINQWELDE